MVSSKDMEPQPRPYLTPEDYLAMERQAETKSEYLEGEMFAMTGGSFAHNAIIGNINGALWQQLRRKPCQICPNDQRVYLPATGLYTYPDVVVICGEPRLQDEHQDTLLNPTVIIEVLSPTTEAYDRGKKFEHYRSIESLVEYLLVSQSEPHVEQYLRQNDNRWLFSETTGLEATLALPSIQCELALAEVYEKIVFAPLGAPASSPAD
ncbi:MAG TPA: Uma2 family endonuclease [Thermoanaerobaculia bacterium]|nr:Uma2 family endonuclease [Thermoanaerobaculia bacterium]